MRLSGEAGSHPSGRHLLFQGGSQARGPGGHILPHGRKAREVVWHDGRGASPPSETQSRQRSPPVADVRECGRAAFLLRRQGEAGHRGSSLLKGPPCEATIPFPLHPHLDTPHPPHRSLFRDTALSLSLPGGLSPLNKRTTAAGRLSSGH